WLNDVQSLFYCFALKRLRCLACVPSILQTTSYSQFGKFEATPSPSKKKPLGQTRLLLFTSLEDPPVRAVTCFWLTEPGTCTAASSFLRPPRESFHFRSGGGG